MCVQPVPGDILNWPCNELYCHTQTLRFESDYSIKCKKMEEHIMIFMPEIKGLARKKPVCYDPEKVRHKYLVYIFTGGFK